MTTFEFRRHSIKDGDKMGTVGSLGKLFARAVGQEFLIGKQFDNFFVSAVPRTMQTLEAFAEGARWTDVERKASVAPLYVLSPGLQQMWNICHKAEKAGDDMVAAAFAFDADLAEETSATVVQLFKEWVLSLPRDARVLVVGHSPHLELLVYGLTRVRLAGLKECQGFRIRTSVLADDVSVNSLIETLTDDLDPSDLRRELFTTPTAPATVRGFAKLWEQ